MFYVYSRYAGATNRGSVRGCFTYRRAAEAFAAALRVQEGETDSSNVVTRVHNARHVLRDPVSGQKITLRV